MLQIWGLDVDQLHTAHCIHIMLQVWGASMWTNYTAHTVFILCYRYGGLDVDQLHTAHCVHIMLQAWGLNVDQLHSAHCIHIVTGMGASMWTNYTAHTAFILCYRYGASMWTNYTAHTAFILCYRYGALMWTNYAASAVDYDSLCLKIAMFPVRFEVPKVVLLRLKVFWDVKPVLMFWRNTSPSSLASLLLIMTVCSCAIGILLGHQCLWDEGHTWLQEKSSPPDTFQLI